MGRCFVLLSGIAVGLSACGPPRDPVGLEPVDTGVSVAPVADGSCNAALFQDLVGEPIGVVQSLNPGVEVRVLAADAFVTRDFNPNRLTFTTTRQDTVGRVFCG